MMTHYDRFLDAGKIAKAFGLNPFDQTPGAQEVLPSAETARRLWSLITSEADQIERLFVRIYFKLQLLHDWAERGHADVAEVDQGREWWELRARALPLLMYRLGYFENTWEDGAGI